MNRFVGASRTSQPDPLDLVEGDGLAAAVVELGGAGAGVGGHLLGVLEQAAVLEVGGDAARPPGVAADPGGDAGGSGTAAGHAVDVGPIHWSPGEPAGAAQGRAEQRALAVLGDA